jgi:cytochrome bd ubiquinol oxidase subunit I
MEIFYNHLILSRLQFAVTAVFHIIWPVFTIGLSLFLVLVEALWLITKDETYYRHCRFWGRLFVLNFSIGVASGIPMEFQFGTNWNTFSIAGGDFFGHMLGFEAAMAFMLEATFLGIMMFGWQRVSARMHLFSTAMVALGASLSAFWIMVANSWMQTPTGGYFENGKFVITSHLQAIFNPDMPWGVSHMWFACIEVTAFAVGGISAWYLLKKRHVPFFLKSFKIAVIAAVVAAPMQIYLGDGSGRTVYAHQPEKLAAIEAHWDTNRPGEGAPWKLLAWPDTAEQKNKWDIEIPYALSIITAHSLTGQVKGLKDFPRNMQPPIVLPFYAFRVMILIGFFLFVLMLTTLGAWYWGKLHADLVSVQRKLLYAWMAALPLSFIAMETGWITREVGRQPWVIYGMLRTAHAASDVPAGAAGASAAMFTGVYLLLLGVCLFYSRRIMVSGPGDAPGQAERR